MKKTIRIAALLAALLLLTALLAGCAAKSTDTPSAAPEQPAAADTTEPAETPADSASKPEDAAASDAEPAPADGAHITRIPSSFDPMALEDCMFPVSFTNDDIELNDEGVMVLHLTVWEQELFDVVDISMLKAGDTITIRGEDVTVDGVEHTDNVVHINGGVENGGVTLAASESGGTFYESIAEVAEYDAVYTSVAQLALPVNADDFVYTDASDPEGEAETYFAGDLLTMKDTVDFACTAMNGTAHIVNDQVAEITRVYTP